MADGVAQPAAEEETPAAESAESVAEAAGAEGVQACCAEIPEAKVAAAPPTVQEPADGAMECVGGESGTAAVKTDGPAVALDSASASLETQVSQEHKTEGCNRIPENGSTESTTNVVIPSTESTNNAQVIQQTELTDKAQAIPREDSHDRHDQTDLDELAHVGDHVLGHGSTDLGEPQCLEPGESDLAHVHVPEPEHHRTDLGEQGESDLAHVPVPEHRSRDADFDSDEDASDDNDKNASRAAHHMLRQQDRKSRLGDLMRWPEKMMDRLCNMGESSTETQKNQVLHRMNERANGLRISTAFSGIDTPGIALSMMSLAIASGLGLPLEKRPRFVNLYGVEWYAKSQDELMTSPDGPSCIYGDIHNFWQDHMAAKVETLLSEGMFVTVMTDLLKSMKINSLVRADAFCVKCNKKCTVAHLHVLVGLMQPQPCCACVLCCQELPEAQPADLHVAGTPCIDFSPRGQKKGLCGPTTGHLFCWLALRLLLEDAYVIQENVPAFATHVLAAVLGHMYHVDTALLDPFELGWPIVRKRRYTVLRHKTKTGAMTQPLHQWSRLFIRQYIPEDNGVDGVGVPDWDVFLVAGPVELREELLWAAGRSQSQWQWNDTQETQETQDDENHGNGNTQPARLNPLDPTPLGPFWRALNKGEQEHLELYRTLSQGQVFQLNQDPDFGANISTARHLRTLIKNSGILW